MTPGSHGIVIVGAGIAGVSCAAALRAGGWSGPVTVLEAGDGAHDRPPLSKDYLAGRVDDVDLQPAQWWQQQDLRLELRTPVAEVAADSVVLASGRRVLAERVVLATGARARPWPAEVAGESGPLTLRTRDDADRLRGLAGQPLVVVGAGLVGAEVAGTMTSLGSPVTLVGRVPLRDVLGEEMASWLHGRHRAAGITLLAGPATDLTETSAVLAGERIDAAGVLYAGGLWRDPTPVPPGVLVAGDRRPDSPGHWDAARQDGQRVAARLLGTDPGPPAPGWWWSDRPDLHLEVVGRPAAGARLVRRGEPEGAWSVFGLADDGRLVGAASVGDSTPVRAARRWLATGVRPDPDALADPGTNLRRLGR